MGILILVVAGLALLGLLAWFLLIRTEGVYLGWPVVVALYDLYASRYDRIKQYDPYYEAWFLGHPLTKRLRHPAPLVLDVATGTGRLPLALLDDSLFNGYIVGLDLSRRMLLRAALKLVGYRGRYDLIWQTATALPFPDDSFDAVSCVESLEFLPNQEAALREMVRALRPGGVLLLTIRKGIDVRLMAGKALPQARLLPMLEALGVTGIEIERWQVDYDLLWARKAGHSDPVGVRPLAEVLCCPACATCGQMIPLENSAWVCGACERRVTVGEDGVIELFKSRRKQS